jgi:RNA recognition motif-containing protein
MLSYNAQRGNIMKATKMKTFSERTLGVFQKGNSSTTIYIGNLRFTKNETEIKKIFSKFGEVNFVRLILDPKTSHSKGFAFVQMPNKDEALNAIKILNGKLQDGRTLKVSIAVESGAKVTPFKKENYKPQRPKETEQTEPFVRRKKKAKGLDVLFNHLNSK